MGQSGSLTAEQVDRVRALARQHLSWKIIAEIVGTSEAGGGEVNEMSLEDKVRALEEQFGIHPHDHPMGDGHHTDVAFSQEDEDLGDVLGWYLGGLFIDIDGNRLWWRYQMTSRDTWARVARALRIHGLRICQQPRPKGAFNPWSR